MLSIPIFISLLLQYMTPQISIIVPCYNQAQYLDECLQSVLDQTHQNWECIVVNDGSPDNTAEIAQQWLPKDQRFKYIYKSNGGLSSARNAGIEQARGAFILPLDADDKIDIDYIKLALIEFKKNPELKVVYCQAEKFGIEEGKWILPKFSIDLLSLKNIIFSSGIYKKSDWVTIGGYDKRLLHGLEDWEFWIALLKNNAKVSRIEYVGFYYRIKAISMAQNITDGQRQQSEYYILRKHIDFFAKMHALLNANYSSLQHLCKSRKFHVNAIVYSYLGFNI